MLESRASESKIFEKTTPYVITLAPGADLFAELRSFLRRGGWEEAWVVSGVGSLERVVICYPRDRTLPPVIERVTLEGPFEIASLSGSLRAEGKEVHVHLHGSFSQKGSKMYGGAVGDGSKVFKIAEILLLVRG